MKDAHYHFGDWLRWKQGDLTAKAWFGGDPRTLFNLQQKGTPGKLPTKTLEQLAAATGLPIQKVKSQWLFESVPPQYRRGESVAYEIRFELADGVTSNTDPDDDQDEAWGTVNRELKVKFQALAAKQTDSDLNELLGSMVATYETGSILSGETLKLVADASRGTGKTPDQLVRGWIDEHKKKNRIDTARDIAAEVTGRKRKSA